MLNCNQFEIIFSIHLPRVFNSTIGRNALGAEYDGLFGFGMMTEIDSLKCFGQCLVVIHALANVRIILRHFSLAWITLRCAQVI